MPLPYGAPRRSSTHDATPARYLIGHTTVHEFSSSIKRDMRTWELIVFDWNTKVSDAMEVSLWDAEPRGHTCVGSSVAPTSGRRQVYFADKIQGFSA